MRFLGSVVAVCAPAIAAAASTMFPVPKNAIEPGHAVIAPGASEQDHFWLKESFPSSSAVDHYERIFSKWRPCHGRESGWESFGDRSKGDERFVHQRLRYWVNAANDTAVTLALMYTSTGLTPRARPDTDRQFVVLIRLKQPDAAKLLSEMGAKCEKDT